ncbi:hypothetical protein BD413DRAFT_484805 [Trametes elegans]|nr:hypothetical protein BD413DRAFT_484805 [Trametes elegans]
MQTEAEPGRKVKQPAALHEPSSKVQLSPKRARQQEHECDYSDIPAYTLPLAAEELEGMLIETLATSRASSLATSDLYGALMAARPALREMALPARANTAPEPRRAWVPALEGVLERGWRRCGVFGKVVNSGTDTGNEALALEARWFYDPDRDEDGERATVVRSMMRRPGKRSETKKAKQYYWRPLPKISRWDPEDEL